MKVFATALFCVVNSLLGATANFDLVVYGGTAGGVITAVSGAREGLKVVLLEPGSHLGGMTTGGLSRTDFGKNKSAVQDVDVPELLLKLRHQGMVSEYELPKQRPDFGALWRQFAPDVGKSEQLP